MKLNKKVTIFGKQVTVVALALMTMVGLASAGLLNYYGKFVGTATAEQSVLVDGKDITEGIPAETMGGVAGSTLYGLDHTLENKADTWQLVELGSTKTACAGGCVEGDLTVYPEYKLESMVTSTDLGDEDDIHFYFTPITWSEFDSASFDYNIVSGSERVPHVNMWLRSGEDEVQLTTWNGGNPLAEISDGTATYTQDMFTLLDGSSVTGYDGWEVREVRIQSGNPALDPSPSEDTQVVYVSNVEVNGGTVTIEAIELPTEGYANIPGRVVEFRIAYEFAINAYPGDYSAETKINYIGTVSGSKVTIAGEAV